MAEGVVAPPWEAYGGVKTPAAPAAKPPPWEEAWTAVKGAYQSVKTGIEQMPEKRQEARAQLNREGNNPAALWDRAKTEFAAVPAAVKTFGEDFTKPMKNGLGARVLGTAMDAANMLRSARRLARPSRFTTKQSALSRRRITTSPRPTPPRCTGRCSAPAARKPTERSFR